MQIISGGVFDRFPRVQLVLGHFGEGLVQDIWRTNHWWERQKMNKLKCKQNLWHYWRNNIHVTTSGHFSTPTLKMAIETIGLDRIMFSLDTAYETCQEGSEWWDGIDKVIGKDAQLQLGRDNAIKLFKLKKVHQ
jgi:2,3-dihydroxybenzoate decarboxylase